MLVQITCIFDLCSSCELLTTSHENEIVIQQVDLYVFTWETEFGEIPNYPRNEIIMSRTDDVVNIRPSSDVAGQQDRYFIIGFLVR